MIINIIMIVIGVAVLLSIILAVIRIRKLQSMLNKEIIDYSVLAKEKESGVQDEK